MKRITLTTAFAIAALSFAGNAFAVSTKNIGPAPSPVPGPGPQPSQCIAVTLAGSTFVRICNGGYTAQLGGTYCSGPSYGNGSNYFLPAGQCNNGQQFLGGNLNCSGTACNWTPSQAGFAAGFRPETVYAQYQ